MAGDWDDLQQRLGGVSLAADPPQGAPPAGMHPPPTGSSSIPIAGAGGARAGGSVGADNSFSLHGRGSSAMPLRSVDSRGGLPLNVNYNTIHTSYARARSARRRQLASPADAGAICRRLCQEVRGFFSGRSCYDVMPSSTQVVVVDVSLPLSAAFVSALENKVPFATLWDPQHQQLVGMMTVTDYIRVLLMKHEKSLGEEQEASYDSRRKLEHMPIYQWRGMEWLRMEREGRTGGEKTSLEPRPDDRRLISALIDCSVYAALRRLHQHRIKRLPLLGHAGEVLHVLNYSALLRLLMEHLREHIAPPCADGGLLPGGAQPADVDPLPGVPADDGSLGDLFDYPVRDLGIGCYGEEEAVVHLETPVHEVLRLLIEHDRHSLPIVDGQRRALDVFSRNDVMRLEQQGYYHTDAQLGDAIAERPRMPVLCFSDTDTLGAVAEHLGTSGVRTLYCVDANDKVVGHLSVTHVFDWLMRYDDPADSP